MTEKRRTMRLDDKTKIKRPGQLPVGLRRRRRRSFQHVEAL
jgi:hypothetical protein